MLDCLPARLPLDCLRVPFLLLPTATRPLTPCPPPRPSALQCSGDLYNSLNSLDASCSVELAALLDLHEALMLQVCGGGGGGGHGRGYCV